MVGWFFGALFFYPRTLPRTSNDQPVIIVGSRPKFQVILLGCIEGIHGPGMVFPFSGNSVDGLIWLDRLLSETWLFQTPFIPHDFVPKPGSDELVLLVSEG